MFFSFDVLMQTFVVEEMRNEAFVADLAFLSKYLISISVQGVGSSTWVWEKQCR
jgi:hypothetical protein